MSRDPQLPSIQTIDLELRSIAKRRAALDGEEVGWLREAQRVQLWRPLGMVSMLDYLERVLGYTPRVATERLRVANALAELPVLAQALADGSLHYSVLREVTRVAVPATEAEWCAAVQGMNMRQIEELVATHKAGDRPGDPGDPDLRPRVVRFELSPETFARLRQAHAALDAEHGEHLDDEQFVATLCGLALDPQQPTAESPGRAKFQVATIVCERCEQGWQIAAGAKIPVSAAAVARAQCDAQNLGSLDDDAPDRATQDVTPKTRRFVWLRDGQRCVIPGCRSARNLEIHHVVHRSDGGKHDASNLRVLCSAHHIGLHDGTVVLPPLAQERPPAPVVSTPMAAAAPQPDPRSRFAASVLRVEVRSALVSMGWPAAIASAAVDQAITHVGAEARTVDVLRAALRCCPTSTVVLPAD